MEKELFDGRWKLLGTREKKYVLENIFNGNKICISYTQLTKIRNGTDTVSRIICRRIENGTPFVTNNVYEIYKKNKLKHMR